jgi:NAD(P)-dependent dehydrogenase (short-subunit alcohol dehydrogenase family)
MIVPECLYGLMARPREFFGGSRGIGGAIASRLARDGFDVPLTYVSRPDHASDLAAAIEDTGRRAIAIRADSGDPVAIRYASLRRSSVSARSTSPWSAPASFVSHWSRRSRSRIST